MEMPNVLFKYRAVNERLRDLIVTRKLYFSSMADFNDPFDCAPVLESSGRVKDYEHIFRDSTDKRLRGLDRRARKHVARGLMKQHWMFKEKALGTPEADKWLQEVVMGELRQTGIFSMTSANDDILMWSHYADSHRGVALIFRTDNELFGEAAPIQYSEQRPVVNMSRDKGVHMIAKCLLTKSLHWAYEREWRLLERHHIGQVAYDRDMLMGVILGARITEENEAFVRARVRDSFQDVMFYRTRFDDREFKLSIDMA